MRISDWSSDVCSSDLRDDGLSARILTHRGLREHGEVERRFDARYGAVRPDRAGRVRTVALPQRFGVRFGRRQRAGALLLDRKSVGEGKRVSISVDVGDGRILQKKNTINITEIN